MPAQRPPPARRSRPKSRGLASVPSLASERTQERLGRGSLLRVRHHYDLSVVPFRRGGKQLPVLLSHLVSLGVFRIGSVAGLIFEADDEPDLVGVRLAAVYRIEPEALDLPLLELLHDVLHLLVPTGLVLHPGNGSEHGVPLCEQ